MIGDLLGHYRILSKLGEGGMGSVYRARDELLHRDVAVKIVSDSAVSQKTSKEFLLHEARSSSALSHPNICTIYEVGERMGELFIVMELAEGQTLSSLIGGTGLPVATVLRYGSQIAAALAHAHSRNIIHRDLKSANVVVTPEGLVKVLDFGLARRMPVADVSGEKTATIGEFQPDNSVGGTLPYMAPEVLRGDPGDYRSDLWALGVMLYESASGQLPFTGKTNFELSSAILHDIPPPLPARIPPGVWAIIQRCLIKEPAQRYQLASEVQAALDVVQSASIIVPEQRAQVDPRGPGTTVHRGIRHLQVKSGDVLLMVGTMKGLFLLRSSAQRTKWDIAGPYFPGQSIYAVTLDQRAGRRRMWASTRSMMWGTFLRSSDDFGKTWINPQEANIKFPPDTGATLQNIWQIQVGPPEKPDTLYCGVEPAALFESHDCGETWTLVRGLFDHPQRPRWMPGLGGLTLHTILLDPAIKDRIYVAISAGGVYVSDDAGQTWCPRNKGVRVVFAPERYPEFGQCVHKMVQHPARPERLFLQNHWGLYRSEDHAESWQDVANGVPSDFGFAMVMHPHDVNCVYIVPVESDEFRCSPEGRLRVYRTRNAGESWEPLTRGLPQKGAYETVLRDAMTADSLHPVGIYFGTRNGELFASNDEGKNWKKIFASLPQIVCVKSAIVGGARTARKPKPSHPAPKLKKRRI
jgi:serine/threonine protein kinase